MSKRLENLLGALAVALTDSLADVVTAAAGGHAGAAGAALAVIAQEPGLSIEQLKVPLGRTQSATVRIVNQLVATGHAERRSGPDGRSVAVFLTAQGDIAAAAVLDHRRGVFREAIGTLDAAERRQLEGMVAKLLTAMTTGVAEAERICRLCDVAACPQRSCPVEQAAHYGPRQQGRPVPRPISGKLRNDPAWESARSSADTGEDDPAAPF